MTEIQISTVISKNEDGSDITQDVDVLVWWRDVENEDKLVFLSRQFLDIPVPSATAERVLVLQVSRSQTCANLYLKVR